MLKSTRARAVAIAALLFALGGGSAVAGGLFAIAEYGIRYIPQAISPPNCRNPDRVCSWVNSADNNLYLHTASGADLNITTTAPTPQFMTATFTAVDNVALTWLNLGGTQYVTAGTPVITDGGGGVVLHLTSKTSTGATLKASAPFTGTVAVTVVSQ